MPKKSSPKNAKKPAGVPREVLAEFEARLDRYLADWKKSLLEHLAAVEGKQATQAPTPSRKRARGKTAKAKKRRGG